jgi:hypothetical protein
VPTIESAPATFSDNNTERGEHVKLDVFVSLRQVPFSVLTSC